MMHSAVCSSVSVGVASRPLLESSRSGCLCSNVLLRRGGHHHAVDCQASNRATGFGKLKKFSNEGVEFIGRKAGIEKPKLKQWFVFRAGAAAAGFFYLVASSASTSEEESSSGSGSSSSSSSSASLNGSLDRRANARVNSFDEEALASGNQGGNQGNKNLVQALHDAASVFKSAMEDQVSLTRGPWFAQKWLGIDKNAWMRTLAYQAAVHSLLQAVQEIAARGEGRDRDVHIFVQRSLMRQSAPLKDMIQQELSTRDPSADDWLWLKQHPQAVASFVSILENDKRFTLVTSTGWEGTTASPSKDSDLALLTLSLSSSAAVMEIGAAAVSCHPFSLLLTEEISRGLQKLPECMSMKEVYFFSSSVGLKREFLKSFGGRAADIQKWEVEENEGTFWIDQIQQLLCAALVREGVQLRLKSTASAEVLEKDLAVFGFFVALGRRTRAYLASRGVGDAEEAIASLLRYLDGGCILFYPQLSSVSSYQLFVEVVCEEMAWLSFYPGASPITGHGQEHDKVKTGVSKVDKQRSIALAVQVCSLWVDSFMQNSAWVQQPEGFRATSFLQRSRQRLEECNEAYRLVKQGRNYKDFRNFDGESARENVVLSESQAQTLDSEKRNSVSEENLLRNWDGPNLTPLNTSKLTADQMGLQEMERQLKSFDKELQSVELAIQQLEILVNESEANQASEREPFSAVRADLEKIWSLKKEVEYLEASLKSKASLLQKSLTPKPVQGNRQKSKVIKEAEALEELDTIKQSPRLSSQSSSRGNPILQGAANLGQGFVRFMFPFSNLKKERDDMDEFSGFNSVDGLPGYDSAELVESNPTVLKEVEAFEQLRSELAALEYRIRQSAGQAATDRPLSQADAVPISSDNMSSSSLTLRSDGEDDNAEVAGAYGDVFSKSIEKLKDASSDAWRGTRLLGTDVGVAVILLKRSVAGQELTDREQKILKRTFTDLASVVPIGFLMLLPVTAVGHAAILAAIQKYVPALIPSAYGRERLDVLRRLEQLKDLESETGDGAAVKKAGPRKEINGGATGNNLNKN